MTVFYFTISITIVVILIIGNNIGVIARPSAQARLFFHDITPSNGESNGQLENKMATGGI